MNLKPQRSILTILQAGVDFTKLCIFTPENFKNRAFAPLSLMIVLRLNGDI